jgi:hypothetical protein
MEATKLIGLSFSTFSVSNRTVRYWSNLRKTCKKCSARRIFPGTASLRISSGKAGFESQESEPEKRDREKERAQHVRT